MSTQEEMLRTLRPWLMVLFGILFAAVVVFAVQQLWPVMREILQVLAPFIIALIVAYVFHPIVTFVQTRLHLGRVGGIAVLMTSIAIVFIGAMVWLVPVIYHQIIQAYTDITTNGEVVFNRLTQHFLDADTRARITNWASTFFKDLDSVVKSVVTSMGSIQPVATGGLTTVKNVAGGVFSGVRAVTLAVVMLALVVVIAIYYLLDMHAMPRIIRRLLPERHRERIWAILLEADRNVGGFLRGQLIACMIVGVLTSIFLVFVGLKQYAILIGCFAGLMHFIPYLGPVAGGAPAVLWVLLSQNFESWPERGLYVLIIIGGFAVIETIDGFITQPYIVGRTASLHPLTVMLALAIGAQAGIGGMIVAVPLACVVKVLWVELYWKKRPDPGLGPSCPVELTAAGNAAEGPSCAITPPPPLSAVPVGPVETSQPKD